MLRTFIQFTVFFVTSIATFFWIRGAALLSVKDLAVLAGTRGTIQEHYIVWRLRNPTR